MTVERFGNGKPTAVVYSLAQAVQQVTQWHQEAAPEPSAGFRDAPAPG
jgi:hypothetical protein